MNDCEIGLLAQTEEFSWAVAATNKFGGGPAKNNDTGFACSYSDIIKPCKNGKNHHKVSGGAFKSYSSGTSFKSTVEEYINQPWFEETRANYIRRQNK